jgi:hypothetical protein
VPAHWDFFDLEFCLKIFLFFPDPPPTRYTGTRLILKKTKKNLKIDGGYYTFCRAVTYKLLLYKANFLKIKILHYFLAYFKLSKKIST